MTKDLQDLFNLANSLLLFQCPVLSGNMKSGIKLHKIGENEITIVIEAPFYDADVWKRTGAIKLTGESINGKTSYAYWVNKSGAFGTHNKSMHWANRVCFEASSIIANKIGAKVINELPL